MQQEAKLIHQQQIVINSLKKKCEAAEFEEFRQFEEELRQAQMRFSNMKNEVQNHQNIEVAKMQTAIKNGGTMLSSSMNGSMFASRSARGSPAQKRKRAAKKVKQVADGDQEEVQPEEEQDQDHVNAHREEDDQREIE